MIEVTTTTEQDSVFIETVIGTSDPIAACVAANIISPEWPVTVVARIMMERPEIEAAINTLKRLKRDGVSSPQITRESIIADMQNVYEKCMLTGDTKAAIASKRLQAELNQWLDKNITVTHRHDPTQLTEAQLLAIINSKPIDGEWTDVTDKKEATTLGQLPAR